MFTASIARTAAMFGPVVGVVARDALALLVDAHVAVRLDEARQHPAPGGVDHPRVRRHLDLGRGADRHDPPVPDQHGAALDRRGRDGDDTAAGDGDDGRGTCGRSGHDLHRTSAAEVARAGARIAAPARCGTVAWCDT
jgi:hypothetical protein